MSGSYVAVLGKHLAEIVETLEERGTVIPPPRLGQPVIAGLVVQADTTKLRHIIQHLARLDVAGGDHELIARAHHDGTLLSVRDSLEDLMADAYRRGWNEGQETRNELEAVVGPGPRLEEAMAEGNDQFRADHRLKMEDLLICAAGLKTPDDLGPLPDGPETIALLTNGQPVVLTHHLIGDTVQIDGDIMATVSEILIYGGDAIRYKCEYFHQGENKAPWIQEERLETVDPNPA